MIEEKFKLETENWIDVTIISVSITLFALIAGLKPIILSSNIAFALQLVLTLPLFMCCIFIRSKVLFSKAKRRWGTLQDICFTLGYGFFINSVGILLSYFVPINIVMVFFLANILLSLIRQYLKIIEGDRKKTFVRMAREISYILIMVLLGILPALNNR